MIACFVSVQMGALATCVLIMTLDAGPFAALEGVGIWFFTQILTFPLALIIAPFGALLRMVVGGLFERPTPVALATGVALGLLGATVFPSGSNFDWQDWLVSLGIGASAGLTGGWTWLRFEDRFGDLS